MIAACALLCLTLPHLIVGSILQQQQKFPQMQNLIVKKVMYPTNTYSNENADINSSIQKYVEVLKYDPQQNIQQWYVHPLNNHNNRQKKHYQSSEEQQKTYQRTSEEQKRFQRSSEEQKRLQRSSEEQKNYKSNVEKYIEDQHKTTYNQKKYNNQGLSQFKQQQKYQQRDASQEQVNYQQFNQYKNIDSEERQNQYKTAENSQELRSLYNEEQSQNYRKAEKIYKNIPAFGDVISWKGLVMAVGPKSPVDNTEDIKNIFNDAYTTMPLISEEKKMEYRLAYETAARSENEDVSLNTTELLKKNNYAVEEYTVKTSDGYILTLFRIPPKTMTRDVQKRPVVFLMHGLESSSDEWVLMGPGKSLAYLLSDAGYDVWLGNARGNKYSRHHVSKHPSLPEFWKFSNDEIALLDLPTMIDYALQTSNQQKLHYIGHSEGTTAFFALVAARPSYNNKIITMHALSPMVYMTHVRSPLIKMIAPNSVFYDHLRNQVGSGEFLPSKELLFTVGGNVLEKQIGNKDVSRNAYFVMSGVNMEQIEPSLIPVIMSHMPAGVSTRQLKQYGQAVASREFRMYDYGTPLNMKVYESPMPPKYDLSAVTTPVALYYSERDWLAHPKDVARLKAELPNVTDYYKVPVEQFGSMDFQLSKSAPELVYKRIIDSIQKNTAY